jgi:hypothetical protein
MHKQVTPGWPVSNVGNEPSGCCRLASQASARFTASSTRCHSSDESTLAGELAFVRSAAADGALGLITGAATDACANAGAAVGNSKFTALNNAQSLFLMKLRYR